MKYAEMDFDDSNSKRCTLPPDTGASMNTAPIFSAAAAISLETAGSMVEESINSVPFFTFLKGARQYTVYSAYNHLCVGKLCSLNTLQLCCSFLIVFKRREVWVA